MKKYYQTFATLSIVLLCLFFSGCLSDQGSDDTNKDNASSENKDTSQSGVVLFEYLPVDLEKVAYILPMGGMSGGHVTPIDHQYYISCDFDLGTDAAVDIDVYSPAAGIVTSIQHMSVAAGDTPIPVDDFRLVIQHTSTISSIYIHIDELSEKLAAIDPGFGEYATVHVEVTAGEVIGRYGGSVDYNVVDEAVTLPFINPASYEREPWKIHCTDPFEYFNESLKSTLIEKCVRTHDPFGGKICYDIDGKLLGTWFEEGTNGYEGLDPDRYWAGHLSIVYDSIDPEAVIVSIGTFVDTAEQFAVLGNSPDPATISVEEDLVVYELVDFEYVTNGTVWDRNNLVKGLTVQTSEYVQGVILLQLLEDRQLKVEIFPGKTAAEVPGFTDGFCIYER